MAEAAKAPESNLKWLRKLVKRGVLHNVLQRYSLIAIDTSDNKEEIAAKFTSEINWKDCSLYAKLKSNTKQDKNVYDQQTMHLAAAFADIVEREDLIVEMRAKTVDDPNYEALNTLGVPAYDIGLDTTINIDKVEFKKLVRKELNMSQAESLNWRDGDETTIEVNSSITPELTVKLKYVHPKKDSLKG